MRLGYLRAWIPFKLMSNIDYTKHSDKRVNNPTIENRNFFAAEESKPYNTMYPRALCHFEIRGTFCP